MRRHGPDQLVDEWMFAGVDGCLGPERAIRSFDRGPAAAQAARPQARRFVVAEAVEERTAAFEANARNAPSLT